MSRPVITTVLILALAAGMTLSAQTRQRAGGRGPHLRSQWRSPDCTVVRGLPSMHFLDGDRIGTNDFVYNTYASDIVVSATPNVLYAAFDDAIYVSRDSGCTWAIAVPALGLDPNQAHHLAYSSGEHLFAYDRNTLVSMTEGSPEAVHFPTDIAKLRVDPADAADMLAIGVDGTVVESGDGGRTWTVLGDATRQLVEDVSFDPSDFDHVIISSSHYGVAATYDRGRTWQRILSPVSFFPVVRFSPADPRIVWCADEGVILRSTDGGRTFSTILTGTGSIPLGSPIPHPSDPDKVVFISGSVSAGAGLAFFDARAAFLHRTAIPTLGPAAVAWSPAGTLYFSGADGSSSQ